jgi:hypothetical protein
MSVGNATIAANSEEHRIFGQGKSFINVDEGPTNPNILTYLNTITMLLSMSTVSLSNSALVIMAPLQFKPRDGNNYNIAESHVHIWRNNLICNLLFFLCVYFMAIPSIAPVKGCSGDCRLYAIQVPCSVRR